MRSPQLLSTLCGYGFERAQPGARPVRNGSRCTKTHHPPPASRTCAFALQQWLLRPQFADLCAALARQQGHRRAILKAGRSGKAKGGLLTAQKYTGYVHHNSRARTVSTPPIDTEKAMCGPEYNTPLPLSGYPPIDALIRPAFGSAFEIKPHQVCLPFSPLYPWGTARPHVLSPQSRHFFEIILLTCPHLQRGPLDRPAVGNLLRARALLVRLKPRGERTS